MAEITLGLSSLLSVILCILLYRSLKSEISRSRKYEDELRKSQAAMAVMVASKSAPLTAGAILEAKKHRAPFTTHKSWAEERAELEARDDQERIKHDKLVAELEKETPNVG